MSNYRSFLRDSIELARQQGWLVEENKKVIFYPSNKDYGPIVAHYTPSDWRAMKNLRSVLRRAGLEDI